MNDPKDIIERIDQHFRIGHFDIAKYDALMHDACAEIIQLRDSLSKFRKTADDVYFNGKDTLYCPHGHEIVGAILWDGMYCIECCDNSAQWYDASELFSTPEAARAAKERTK